MLYTLTKPFAKIALGIYFRKLYISNRELVPTDKPVLLAANHPTAFLEPCILSCWLDQPLSFIARGDLYLQYYFIRKLYDWYRMTPVFRIDDAGYGNLKNNFESFDRCFDALEAQRTIMILAEGRTLHEKRLRPIMKGSARIVFGALEKYGDLDIHVVPVGVNYSNPDNFRSVTMIDFGPPIRATEYTRLYQENPAKAINKLTREIGKRLKERVIHIEEEADEMLTERLLEMLENDHDPSFPPAFSPDSSLLSAGVKTADRVNKLKPDERERLVSDLEDYFQALKKNGLSDLGLVNQNFAKPQWTLFAVLGWLPQMVGKIWNGPPVWLGNFIAKKVAPSIEFRASSAVVFAAALWLIWGFGQALAVVLWGEIWMLALLAMMPALGYFHLIYRELAGKWKAAVRVKKLNSSALEGLLRQRKKIQENHLAPSKSIR